LFENLAEATLGAIVIQAVWGMVKFEPLTKLWRAKTFDFWLALGALLGVILLGILPGIVVGVVLSLILFQHRVDKPHTAILGRRRDTNTFGDVEVHPDAETTAGVLVYRWDAPLIFPNADHFVDDVLDRVAATPDPLRAVVVNCQAMYDFDTTGAEAMGRLKESLESLGIGLYLTRLIRPVHDYMDRVGATQVIGSDRVFSTTRDAVDALGTASPDETE
jgi:SulP family sulfate permease